MSVFFFRFVVFCFLPAPLQYAASMAWYLHTKAKNPRSRDRWLQELRHQWARWRNRHHDPVIFAAQVLYEQGWRLASDWPLLPPQRGEVLFGVKLAKSNKPYITNDELGNVAKM